MLFLVCHLHLALFAEISWKARCFFGHCRPNVVLNGVNHVNLLPPELMSTLPNYAHACWVLQRGARDAQKSLQLPPAISEWSGPKNPRTSGLSFKKQRGAQLAQFVGLMTDKISWETRSKASLHNCL